MNLLNLTIPLWIAIIIISASIIVTRFMLIFKWSKVEKGKKPIGWWYHKIMCELWYHFKGGGGKYYKHLNIICDKYKINLYGRLFMPYEPIGKTVLDQLSKKYISSMADKLDKDILKPPKR